MNALVSSTLPMFDAPPAAAPLASEVLRSADLDGPLRWTLTRRWRSGPHVLFIGHNPAGADHLREDQTSLRWIRLAWSWGFGGYVGANLYPVRTADPAECRGWAADALASPKSAARDALLRNVEVLVAEARRADFVVACWGAIAADPAWVELVAAALVVAGVTLHCLGTTRSGAPIHPMARGKSRVPDFVKPQIWRTP